MSIHSGREAPAEVPITEADVAGFAAKLEAWYETLPAGEQAVLQRLLACVEGTASEECDVEGYALTGIGARLTRLCAAGLMAATLTAPITASAAPSAILPVNPVVATLTQTPAQAIAAKAAALGLTFTGNAVSGLETVPNGHCIRYQKCDIYYSPSAGAHEVHGGIRDKYNLMGGALGHLGLPRTDELVTSDGIGRYNEFAGDASIYWSPHTGPFALEGGMRAVWVNSGAESSRFGYPTAAAKFQNGNQWQDFQNDVIFFEGTHLRATENVELTREQLTRALLNFIRSGLVSFVLIDSFSIRSVSNTGHDFSQSRNRRVTVHLEGHVDLTWRSDPHYGMDLNLLFFAQKEADGSTSLRMMLADDYEESVTVDHNHSPDVDEKFIREIVRRFYSIGHAGAPSQLFPVKLVDVTIPAAVPVLSFKVLEDGALKLFLPLGGGSSLVQLAIQLAFDRLGQ